MARLRYNKVLTTLDDALADEAGPSTIEFASALQEGGVNVPTISSPDYIVLVVNAEVMHLTDYTAGAVSGTVDRGQEDTETAAHDLGDTVYVAPTKEDFDAANINFDPAGLDFTAATNVQEALEDVDGALSALPVELGFALSDEVTELVAATGVLTIRMPFAMELTAVRASLSVASSSGVVTVDINEGGSTILSTKLSIDQDEKTSTTAATPPVISDNLLGDDAEVVFDIDADGTGAKGLKVWLIGFRS